jgi:hypothetical protein
MAGSYNDETVRAKLSALNDSQDSIVAVAQWVMFHRYVHSEDPEDPEDPELRNISFPFPHPLELRLDPGLMTVSLLGDKRSDPPSYGSRD